MGVALAFVERPDQGEAPLIGDLMALVGAFGCSGIALCARATRIGEEHRKPFCLFSFWLQALRH